MSRGEQAPIGGGEPVDGMEPGDGGQLIQWEPGKPFSILLRMMKSMVVPDGREKRRIPFGKMKCMKKKSLNQMKKEERPKEERP